MKRSVWLLVPAAIAVVLIGAQLRAHTAPKAPAVVPARQVEVPITSSLGVVDVTGIKSGKFPGNGSFLSFEYEVLSPRDPATGLPTGKRQHKPVVITKHIDAASPLYFSALVTNETLSKVVFNFTHRSADGAEVNYYTVTLTNATVSDFHQSTMKTENNSSTDKMETEQIAFTFQKIEITFSNNTAQDDWNVGT